MNEHSPHERKPVLCLINQMNVDQKTLFTTSFLQCSATGRLCGISVVTTDTTPSLSLFPKYIIIHATFCIICINYSALVIHFKEFIFMNLLLVTAKHFMFMDTYLVIPAGTGFIKYYVIHIHRAIHFYLWKILFVSPLLMDAEYSNVITR